MSSPSNYGTNIAINGTTRSQVFIDGLLWWVISVLDYLWVAYQMMVHTVRDRCWRSFYKNNNTRNRSQNNGANSRSRCNSLPELEDCSLSAAIDDSVVITMATTTAASSLQPLPQHEERNVGPISIHPELNGAAEKMDKNVNNNSENPLCEEMENWDWGPIPVDLEPAFLTESRYPSDWLVYHPKLRVIPRTVALRYDARMKQQPQPPLSKTGAPYSATNCLAPDGGGSLASPSLFEDEKKDDNNIIVVGHENLHMASNSRRVGSNTNSSDCSPTTLRRANETSRQPPTNNNNKAENMPIRRSVVAT